MCPQLEGNNAVSGSVISAERTPDSSMQDHERCSDIVSEPAVFAVMYTYSNPTD